MSCVVLNPTDITLILLLFVFCKYKKEVKTPVLFQNVYDFFLT